VSVEAAIELTQRCAPRPWFSEFGDALGGHDHGNLEAVIGRVWTCAWAGMIVRTWRPQSCEFGATLGGCDRARSDEFLEVVLATVPDCHFGSGSGSNPNLGQIGGLHQQQLQFPSETPRCSGWL